MPRADWKLIGLLGPADLPAIKWRQDNLNKLTKEQRADLVAALEKLLSRLTNSIGHAPRCVVRAKKSLNSRNVVMTQPGKFL
jgi:hypothetical protein